MENKITGMWCDEIRDMPKEFINKLIQKIKPVEIIITSGDFDWEDFLAENERLRDGGKF